MCFLIMVEAHPLFFVSTNGKQWRKGERCCYFKCGEEAATIRTSSEGNLWNLFIIKMKNCRFKNA